MCVYYFLLEHEPKVKCVCVCVQNAFGQFGPVEHVVIATDVYTGRSKVAVATQADRVRECVRSVLNGRRIIVFSGGAAKGADSVLDDARAIRDGGGNGSIIGRNAFQRPRAEAMALLQGMVDIYKGKA